MVLRLRVAVWSCLLCSALLAGDAGGCSSSPSLPPSPANGSPDATVDGPSDGPLPPGDASACRPGDVATYRPAAYVPATAAHKGACSDIDIQIFFDTCLGPTKSSAGCSAFKSGKTTGACAACIVTPATADHYGPVIDDGGFVTANVAGCIELTDDLNGFACAKSVQALSGCELAACQANCPVNDTASRAAFDACAAQAAHGEGSCQYYDTMASQCSDAERDAGQAAACLLSVFKNFYDTVVPLFCGSPPQRSDSGSLPFDASSDAGASDGAGSDGPPPGDASGDVVSDAEADVQKE
jgi:hypothetical protein